MAPRDHRHVLEDIDAVIAEIQRATNGTSFEAFQADWLLRHAVQRGLEIISDASKPLPERIKERRPEIRWAAVRGIGNVLRHEHHRVADSVVWAVVVNDLPPLRTAIAALREMEDGRATGP
ncbi:HepT-like ribonuclease domain-containing protein [Methylobacterium oryzisoli]|uniref:HepT-like ribonuclease domain-containing protein n=1 Tax=Methylobacterium oryzisoli TaxID=3385502 RepID=UPI003891AAFD